MNPAFIAALAAFGFASPWLLLGLGLAAVPVIIHLLFRRPHHEVRWAATRFLIAAAKKHSRRLRFEQWLLLLIRAACLLLVALALARPYQGSPRAAVGPEPPRHRILVLDASYSMGDEISGVSRFDRARQAVHEVISAARPGDAFHVVRMSDLGPHVVIGRPAFLASQVADTIDEIESSFGRADPLATLREVLPLLKQAPELRRKEVLIFSDFQRADWRQRGDGGHPLRDVLEEIGREATVRLFDAAAGTPAANTTVVSLDVEGPLVRVGSPARFTTAVRSEGLAAPRREKIELRIDGRLVATESVELRSGENVTIAFEHVFAESGPHGVEVRLPADDLLADNSRSLGVTARDRLRLLLVNGTPAGRPEEAATFYVRQALAPNVSQTSSRSTEFEPVVIDEGQLSDENLSGFDVVLLSNIGVITDREADRLRSFTSAGGGLVIALGDHVRPESYNRLLADAQEVGKKPLLPLRFLQRVGDPFHPETAFNFDASDLSHPVVSPFAGNPGTGLESDFALAYMRVVMEGPVPAAVPLRFEDGDPAIAAAHFGTGRVVLVTTSVDTSWAGPWPQTGRSFLPLMHELVRFAASGQPVGQAVEVGTPLVWMLNERIAGLNAVVAGPGGLSATVPAVVKDDGMQIEFEATTRPGLYTIEMPAPIDRAAVFAVNVDPEEGDLASLDEQERMALVTGAKAFIPGSEGVGAAAAGPDWSISRWLLAAAFGLLLAELVLAWRFAWGLLALAAVAAGLFFRWAWLIDPYLGTAAATICILALGVAAHRLRIASQS